MDIVVILNVLPLSYRIVIAKRKVICKKIVRPSVIIFVTTDFYGSFANS